jgi:hypothetical protein
VFKGLEGNPLFKIQQNALEVKRIGSCHTRFAGYTCLANASPAFGYKTLLFYHLNIISLKSRAARLQIPGHIPDIVYDHLY